MASALQIFGTKKCKNTQKAQRFFKERRIPFHFIDLQQKALSKREIETVARAVGGLEAMLDTSSKAYESLGLRYMQTDRTRTIMEHPLVLATPVVRCGNYATCGDGTQTWKAWVQEGKVGA